MSICRGCLLSRWRQWGREPTRCRRIKMATVWPQWFHALIGQKRLGFGPSRADLDRLWSAFGQIGLNLD